MGRSQEASGCGRGGCLVWLKKCCFAILIFFSPVKECADCRGEVNKRKVSAGLELRRQGHLRQYEGILNLEPWKEALTCFGKGEQSGSGGWVGGEQDFRNNILRSQSKHSLIVCLIFHN